MYIFKKNYDETINKKNVGNNVRMEFITNCFINNYFSFNIKY